MSDTTDDVVKALAEVKSRIEVFTVFEHRREQKELVLSNETNPNQTGIYLKYYLGNCIELAWGPEAEIQPAKMVGEVFDVLQDKLDLQTLDLAYCDARFVMDLKWDGPHYQAIRNAFYKDSSLDKLMGEKVFTGSISLRFQMDDSNVAVVGVESTANDENVRTGRYADCKIKVSVGYARIAAMPAKGRVSQMLSDVMSLADQHYRTNCVAHLVVPLVEEMKKLSTK